MCLLVCSNLSLKYKRIHLNYAELIINVQLLIFSAKIVRDEADFLNFHFYFCLSRLLSGSLSSRFLDA
jgi:hypothetical protein